MANEIAKSDRQWQAESDARTLMEANIIKTDSQRKKRAIVAAKTLATRVQKEANQFKKVTTLKTPQKRSATKKITKRKK